MDSSCVHVMVSGPRKSTICGRPKSDNTKSKVPVCFHHTPERLKHQSERQMRRIHGMTVDEKIEENRVVNERRRSRKQVDYRDSDSSGSDYSGSSIVSISDDSSDCSESSVDSAVTTISMSDDSGYSSDSSV